MGQVLEEQHKKIFKLYFSRKNSKENSTNIKNVISSMEIWHQKWIEFQDILKKYSSEFESFSNICQIKFINYEGVNYFILKVGGWSYLIIDLMREKIIHFEEGLFPFEQDFFIDNFEEERIENPEKYYFSLEFAEEGVPELMNFIFLNRILFTTEFYFKYLLSYGNDFLTFLNFDILKGEITLYLGDLFFDDGRYIFINPDLTIRNYDAFDNIKKISSKLKNIKIPLNKIPAFLLENIKGKDNLPKMKIKNILKVSVN